MTQSIAGPAQAPGKPKLLDQVGDSGDTHNPVRLDYCTGCGRCQAGRRAGVDNERAGDSQAG